MILRISFRLFLACLTVCASMALANIWFGEHVFPAVYYQTMASFFIVGLASFLIWFSSMLISLRSFLMRKP